MYQETKENVANQSPSSIERLSQDELKRLLIYCPECGKFWRRQSLKPAGWEHQEYTRIYLAGKTYSAHALAWFYVYGEWINPDHKNRVKSDNRIDNLRPALTGHLGNQGVRYTNLLGVKGVQERYGKYRAYITVNYKTMHLGTFATIEEAVKARQEAANLYFGEFSNG